MSRDTQLTAGNVHLLEQGVALLERLTDEQYAGPPPIRMSPIGSHLRHCLDFYTCFLNGLGPGAIDYDGRTRDDAVAGDRQVALTLMRTLTERLVALPEEISERELKVSTDRSFDSPEAAWSRTTVRRELQFLRSHTIHHYALIAILARSMGEEPGDEFGVAPSTLEHERQLAGR